VRELFAPLLVVLLALTPGMGCVQDSSAPPEGPPAPPPAAAPCVHFSQLSPFLPEQLEGFTHTQSEGSTGKYGEVSVSEAERTFSRGEDREVKVRILDTTMGGKIGQAIRAAAEGARRRHPSDVTAPIFWEGTVGFVRYDEGEALAEANLLVGERYVVAVTSRGFPGTVEVRRVAQGMDFAGLAQLR
jgi:hypothetical protein